MTYQLLHSLGTALILNKSMLSTIALHILLSQVLLLLLIGNYHYEDY